MESNRYSKHGPVYYNLRVMLGDREDCWWGSPRPKVCTDCRAVGKVGYTCKTKYCRAFVGKISESFNEFWGSIIRYDKYVCMQHVANWLA